MKSSNGGGQISSSYGSGIGLEIDRFLQKNNIECDLKTVFFYDQGHIFEQSDAVIKILTKLGGFWQIFILFKAFPKPLRDICYQLIAKNRYKIVSKRASCRIPSEEERQWFIQDIESQG